MKLVATALVLVASGIVPGNAANADSARTLFVLDASGSMWGRVEERPKISVATDVLSDLLSQLPQEREVGLIAYGHRRKGDCNDIETIVDIAPGGGPQIIEAIEGLSPKGKTPIEGAVRAAVESLREGEDPATVVFVSDGLESCGGDPCAAVRAAQEAGVQFRMHVVGFDLAEMDVSSLQCMADAGGGRYFPASGAADLAAALEEAVEPSRELIVQAVAGGVPVDAEILVGAGDEEVAALQTGDDGEVTVHVAGVGPYAIEGRLTTAGETLVETAPDVRVRKDEPARVTLDFSPAGIGVRGLVNGTPANLDFRLYDSETGEEVARRYATSEHLFSVPSGQYRVEARADEIEGEVVQVWDGIALGADEAVEHVFEFAAGTVRLSSRADGAPTRSDFRIHDAVTGEEVARDHNAADLSIALPPGTYRIEAEAAEIDGATMQVWEDVEIAADRETSHVFDFSAGEIAVAGTVNGRASPMDFRVFDAETGEEVVRRYNSSDHVFALPPGTYRLEAAVTELAGKPVIEWPEVEVVPGETVAHAFEVAAGELAVNGRVNGAPSEMDFRLYDALTGDEVARDYSSTDPDFLLLPGRYEIEVGITQIDGGVVQRKPIEVVAEQTSGVMFDAVAGEVNVSAAAGGQPTSVDYRVYDATTGEEVVRDYNTAEANFMLLPGTYRVEAAAGDLEGKPVQEWNSVDIVAGTTLSHSFDF